MNVTILNTLNRVSGSSNTPMADMDSIILYFRVDVNFHSVCTLDSLGTALAWRRLRNDAGTTLGIGIITKRIRRK